MGEEKTRGFEFRFGLGIGVFGLATICCFVTRAVWTPLGWQLFVFSTPRFFERGSMCLGGS